MDGELRSNHYSRRYYQLVRTSVHQQSIRSSKLSHRLIRNAFRFLGGLLQVDLAKRFDRRLRKRLHRHFSHQHVQQFLLLLSLKDSSQPVHPKFHQQQPKYKQDPLRLALSPNPAKHLIRVAVNLRHQA